MRVFPGCDHRISDYGEAWQEAIALVLKVDVRPSTFFTGDLSILVVLSLYFSTPPHSTEMKKGEACELPLCL